MDIEDDINSNSPYEEQPLSIEKLEQILEECYASLPEKPAKGEPIVLDEYERLVFKEFGQVQRQYRDGSVVLYLSEERMGALRKALGK